MRSAVESFFCILFVYVGNRPIRMETRWGLIRQYRVHISPGFFLQGKNFLFPLSLWGIFIYPALSGFHYPFLFLEIIDTLIMYPVCETTYCKLYFSMKTSPSLRIETVLL